MTTYYDDTALCAALHSMWEYMHNTNYDVACLGNLNAKLIVLTHFCYGACDKDLADDCNTLRNIILYYLTEQGV